MTSDLVMVEREVLLHAKARFECLAEDFERAGDLVEWAMCSTDAQKMDAALSHSDGLAPSPSSDPEGGARGELQYRPNDCDDWGVIRAADGKVFAVVRRPLDEEEAAEHRYLGTDPFEYLARKLIDAISKDSDGGSSPTDVMSSATVPNDSASLKQHAASGQRVNPACPSDQLTKTPSADHDAGNLRSLSAPNHQPHAVSQAAAFVAWAMREGPWEGGDLDGGALQDKAEELGLIIKTTYNPDIHGSCDYGSEPGDDWFVLHPDIEAAARLPAPPSPAKTGGDRG